MVQVLLATPLCLLILSLVHRRFVNIGVRGSKFTCRAVQARQLVPSYAHM